MLQGIQSANGLKARSGAKKSDGTALKVTTKQNAIKKTFGKSFAIPFDFDFFKHPVYPYELKEDLIVTLELYSSKKVILCSGDSAATYKLSDISLAISDEPYATTIDELYAGTKSIAYTRVTSIHCQTLSKKGTTWKIDVSNLSVRSFYKACCYCFLINVMTLQTEMKNFTTLVSRKF